MARSIDSRQSLQAILNYFAWTYVTMPWSHESKPFDPPAMSLSMSGLLPRNAALTPHSSLFAYVRVSREPSCSIPAAVLQAQHTHLSSALADVGVPVVACLLTCVACCPACKQPCTGCAISRTASASPTDSLEHFVQHSPVAIAQQRLQACTPCNHLIQKCCCLAAHVRALVVGPSGYEGGEGPRLAYCCTDG